MKHSPLALQTASPEGKPLAGRIIFAEHIFSLSIEQGEKLLLQEF